MSTPDEWLDGYARQADADFNAWELHQRNPEAVVSECHTLLFPRMACEKLCNVHLISKLRWKVRSALSCGEILWCDPLIAIFLGEIAVFELQQL